MKANHAIVIGGSIAGLCAARVLREFYERVTIVERDRLPADAVHRIGVPQSHHGHGLLARGQIELERFFPGFANQLVARGAERLAASAEFAIFRRWGWAPRVASPNAALWCSRPLIEAGIRERVRALTGIEWVEGSVAEDFVAQKGERLRITGVVVREREGGATRQIPAELVVDASGRSSQTLKWLERLGVARPPEEVVDARAGYASRFYRAPAAAERPADWWWKGLWIEPVFPNLPRGGTLFPVENGGWLATVVGFGEDYPPTEEGAWLEYVESLASPIMAQAVRGATPVSDIKGNRATANCFRHFERWPAAVDGFIAVGDSACAFNPVYGQGMTTGVVCARMLENVLHETGPRSAAFAPSFFRAQEKFFATPWALSTGWDLAWPRTEGKRKRGNAWARTYLLWLFESMHFDPEIVVKGGRVVHLIDELPAAFRPRLVYEVLRSTLARRWQALLGPVVHLGTLPPARPHTFELSALQSAGGGSPAAR